MKWWPWALGGVVLAIGGWALAVVNGWGKGLPSLWRSSVVDDGVNAVTETASNAAEFVSATVGGGAPVYFKGGLSIDDLHPKLREFVEWWRANGWFALKIVSTGRTDAEQLVEYAKGRSGDQVINQKLVVTNAKTARQSAHGWRLVNGKRVACAIDVYPANSPNEIELDISDPRFAQMVEAAEAMGLQSGAHFASPVDWPHLMAAGWESLPYVG